ncbi:MAG: DNA repair protein RecO [Candidatus Azobacteroides pseudotrichonymphae]|jgi:DNA repair protein RecO (recombination protein O)|uniref:DNA repair protein RecO n=1 Tax=Azobacteroides pseudotrichonymphae genomovar. CFP2 TaxID=511995 RepID=RECO_AZOPC|nr:recombination protein O N-terminal domain-containing protein [Candidatus Azobacteroides pseudotrichonymphae]B6YQ41.1 RecName: Full=DNA repair protein RecO; AltName: Full=Recombination protein O [Candidatus Azobacteroides pseudotrichonymphae genomovar. CFP2]MDR0530106.1 DNA repair protein RecO [Bacteroidales bacterium OttesenSCG-928-I14]BAG83313.1 DNA repair protein RecO [Candidatus Azobacteroides pseudotrichonymphae genomovar. CFP2]GMO37168.1 MAG: DNA repair protein RecO [Candidatus Azobacte
MLYKTKAITLYNINYNDNYSIVHVLTEEFGPVSYLTAKFKKQKTHLSKSFFHPLSLVELEVEHKNLREIQYIKEAKTYIPLVSLLNNPIKSSICIFLAEFISKALKEKQSDKLLFNYILQSIQVLEFIEKNYSNFHLVFTIRLSQFLGFYPNNTDYSKGMYFDMQNGIFVQQQPPHTHFVHSDDSWIVAKLLQMNYENMFHFQFTRNERKKIISQILEYYYLHLGGFSKIKSLAILHSVFD